MSATGAARAKSPSYEPESSRKIGEHEAYERFNARRYKLAGFTQEINNIKISLQSIPETIEQENEQKAWIKEKLYPIHGRIGYFISDFLKPR
jgi:hypothetical protein